MARARTALHHLVSFVILVLLLGLFATLVVQGWRKGGEWGRPTPSEEDLAYQALLRPLAQDPALQAVRVIPLRNNACYGTRFEPCLLVKTRHHGTVELVGPDHRLVVVLPDTAREAVARGATDAQRLDAGTPYAQPQDGPRPVNHQVLGSEPLPMLPYEGYLVPTAGGHAYYMPRPTDEKTCAGGLIPDGPTSRPAAVSTAPSSAATDAQASAPPPCGVWWFTVPAGLRRWGLDAMSSHPVPEELLPYPLDASGS